MEPHFGRDFSRVRVHNDSAAAQSARDVNARAYTVGQHVVFGQGEFAPGSTTSQRLLAHELTHVVQQSGDVLQRTTSSVRHATQGGIVQREESTDATEEGETPIMFQIPRTGLTLIPGIMQPSFLGARFPLPASLRLTNANSVGSGPTFVLDLSPERVMANIVGSINLHSWTRPGTPPQAFLDPDSLARIRLVNPVVTL